MKWFHWRDKYQTLLLVAFEEEGWPAEVDDPLPPSPDVDPASRLHDTVRHLTQATRKHGLYFGTSQHGERATWRFGQKKPGKRRKR